MASNNIKNEDLIRLLTGWGSHKVVVGGDYMLDRYVYGNADRLSPDAPVPVLTAQRSETRPGGASNVCLDLRALRCEVACVGVVGKDQAGQELREALAAVGCDVSGLITTADRPTTVKHNFIGLAQHRHPQKMFRVDDEIKAPIPAEVEQRLMDKADKLLKKATVLCLEDYNKGVLTPGVTQGLIEAARQRGVPVLIDPAAIEDYQKYRGATCITPNRSEAALATARKLSPPVGDAKWEATVSADGLSQPMLEAIGRLLLRQLDLESVVLTLDKHGAMLIVKGQKPVLVPTQARAVYDVTGAGDMVLAMLAAARANGADWHAAVQLANTAAGLEVERFGVVPIELDEVLLALLQKHHEGSGKVRTLEQLLPELAAYRKQGKRIAFTNGCFDILHAGHVALLRGARQTADLLVLAVNTDASIRRLKGPLRPIVPQEDRLTVLQELECVDYVILFGDGSPSAESLKASKRVSRRTSGGSGDSGDSGGAGGSEGTSGGGASGGGDTPKALLRAIKPDVLVKGGTYKLSEVVGADIVKSYGGQVVTIPPVQGRSTTKIVEKIKATVR